MEDGGQNFDIVHHISIFEADDQSPSAQGAPMSTLTMLQNSDNDQSLFFVGSDLSRNQFNTFGFEPINHFFKAIKSDGENIPDVLEDNEGNQIDFFTGIVDQNFRDFLYETGVNIDSINEKDLVTDNFSGRKGLKVVSSKGLDITVSKNVVIQGAICFDEKELLAALPNKNTNANIGFFPV